MKIQAGFKSANCILNALLPNKIRQIPRFDLAVTLYSRLCVGEGLFAGLSNGRSDHGMI